MKRLFKLAITLAAVCSIDASLHVLFDYPLHKGFELGVIAFILVWANEDK